MWPSLSSSGWKSLTLKCWQHIVLKLDERRSLKSVMRAVFLPQSATRGLFTFFLFGSVFFDTLNAVCLDYASCVPFSVWTLLDGHLNYSHIEHQIRDFQRSGKLQTSRMRTAHLNLIKRKEKKRKKCCTSMIYFFQTCLKDFFLTFMNSFISKSIFSCLNILMDVFEVGPQRLFVFLSHWGGRVAQLLVQLAKLIPSCHPQEPHCSLRPHQPSAGAHWFLKSPRQRWTHRFTHFLFGHPVLWSGQCPFELERAHVACWPVVPTASVLQYLLLPLELGTTSNLNTVTASSVSSREILIARRWSLTELEGIIFPFHDSLNGDPTIFTLLKIPCNNRSLDLLLLYIVVCRIIPPLFYSVF